MLKKILLLLVLLVAAFAVVIALQPADFAITRSATMSAPASTVFAQVNDFHKWAAWSPWEKMDPNMKRTFEGPAEGVGTSYSWAGNSEVGEGKMTITDTKPTENITIRLEFLKPMPATNKTEFTFKPSGDQTVVTWTMSGHKNFMMKGFCMFMNMDEMVGPDFERGLASLKSIVENGPAK